jgi:hypothetical protein
MHTLFAKCPVCAKCAWSRPIVRYDEVDKVHYSDLDCQAPTDFYIKHCPVFTCKADKDELKTQQSWCDYDVWVVRSREREITGR